MKKEFSSSSYKEIFGVDAQDFDGIPLYHLNLAHRTYNTLMRCRIETIGKLLRYSDISLAKYNSVGSAIIEDVNNMLSEYITSKCINPGINSSLDKQSFIEETNRILDPELIKQCQENPDYVNLVIRGLGAYSNSALERCAVRNSLRNSFNLINNRYILEANVLGLIDAYTDDAYLQKALKTTEKMDQMTLTDYVNVIVENSELYIEKASDIKSFIVWCNFDIFNDVVNIHSKVISSDRIKHIIFGRMENKTLAELGSEIGITRERVRQCEGKAQNHFNNLISDYCLMKKIYAIRNRDNVLTEQELSVYFREYSNEFIYLLKKCSSTEFSYREDLKAFVVGDISLVERADSYFDRLPDVFLENQYQNLIENGISKERLTEEIIVQHLNNLYKKTGKIYHRTRLTLQDCYSFVMREYFPEGMHVYSPKEIDRFRMILNDVLGLKNEIPENDRALIAGITRGCILCGRGTYVLKTNTKMSDELIERICEFIDSCETEVVLISTVFNEFFDEFSALGINNKYYVLGILKKNLSDKYIIKRDYICKDKSFTSIYEEIVLYISQSDYPVTKEEIFLRYPGLTEIVFCLSISSDEIINMFGSYFHASKLRISDSEKDDIKNLLAKLVEESDGCIHIKDVYNTFDSLYGDVLNRNYIVNAYSLFSLLRYLFEDFIFERPYIAFEGYRVDNQAKRMIEYICSKRKICISELTAFSREIHYQLGSVTDYIIELDNYYLINSDEATSKENIGLTAEIINEVLLQIKNEVNVSIPVFQLSCVSQFPKINVKWNEWLIYSIVRKHSTDVDAIMSTNKLKSALPILYPKGSVVDIDEYTNIVSPNKGYLEQTDDLERIDDLLGEISVEDI